MSSLADTVLFIALVLTSLCVLMMHRRLKRLDSHQAEYKRALDQTHKSLSEASLAIQTFGADSREVLNELNARINEARTLISQLEALSRERTQC